MLASFFPTLWCACVLLLLVLCWCRYTPAKSPMKPIVFTQKLDYSHVQSRIDIGSPKSSLNSKQYLFSSDGYTRTRSRVTPNHSRSSSASKINPGRSISPSSKPVRLGSSAQYSHIKSRIDCGHPVVSHSESSKSTGSLNSPRSTLSQSSKSDYSHIKSRTDSGRKSAGSMSTKSQRSTSLMSRNKVSCKLQTIKVNWVKNNHNHYNIHNNNNIMVDYKLQWILGIKLFRMV